MTNRQYLPIIIFMTKENDAAWMRHLLNGHGLTQAEAAELIGVSPRMMRYYLSGRVEVPAHVWMALQYETYYPGESREPRPPKKDWLK